MRKSAVTRQRLAGVFLVGVLLFYSPILSLFDTAAEWFGFPVALVYLFGAWLLVILLAAWTVERDDR